jgi:AcrR family transcriptional regulator
MGGRAVRGAIRPASAALPEMRRQQIIAAASEVICRRGVDGARLKDVADEAGVSLGLVQHYFRTRDALVRETFEALLDLSIRTWAVVAAREPDPVRRLMALLRFQVQGWAPFATRWSFWVEFWSATSRDPRLQELANDIYRRWESPWRALIKEGVAAGVFRPALPMDQLISLLTALADGGAVRSLVAPGALTQDEFFELLLATAQQLLRLDADVCRAALGSMPRVIGTTYPDEPAEHDGIDWSAVLEG